MKSLALNNVNRITIKVIIFFFHSINFHWAFLKIYVTFLSASASFLYTDDLAPNIAIESRKICWHSHKLFGLNSFFHEEKTNYLKWLPHQLSFLLLLWSLLICIFHNIPKPFAAHPGHCKPGQCCWELQPHPLNSFLRSAREFADIFDNCRLPEHNPSSCGKLIRCCSKSLLHQLN